MCRFKYLIFYTDILSSIFKILPTKKGENLTKKYEK